MAINFEFLDCWLPDYHDFAFGLVFCGRAKLLNIFCMITYLSLPASVGVRVPDFGAGEESEQRLGRIPPIGPRSRKRHANVHSCKLNQFNIAQMHSAQLSQDVSIEFHLMH